MIMAAGTGGNVFPALSIAETFKARAINVEWLGTPSGMENELLNATDIPLHQVSVKGLRGAGIVRILLAPFMLLRAFIDSYKVLRKVDPDFVIGMGGFVCGPAGLACKIQGRPLFIHEQNAVAGLTNRLLAPMATRVFEAFPKTFSRNNVIYTGNPLRNSIKNLARESKRDRVTDSALNVLILGGSQGAQAINRTIPAILSSLSDTQIIQSLHQTGARNFDETLQHYESLGVNISDSHRLVSFIDDIAEAFTWADLVICRSGASTVSEIAAAGLPAVFIPYPYHKDQQQKLNANWLASNEAAIILEQSSLEEKTLFSIVDSLMNDRQKLTAMGERAHSLAVLDADERIVENCVEVLHEK